MIHIGNQTAFSAATLTEPFEFAVANAFDAFEWFPDKQPNGAGWDENDLDDSLRRNIRETALTRGLRLSVHARWQANPLQPDSYPMFLRDLELAQALGAALLNIHLYGEEGPGAYVEAITPLLRCVAEAGLQLAIENSPPHTPEDFNELFAHIQKLESVPTEHVGMCFDLGHANLCAATRNDYLKYLERLSPDVPIIHLHLHENWGDTDSHLPLFTGPAGRDDSGIREFLEQIRRRDYSGSIILEQWPQPPSLLTSARERLTMLLHETAPLTPSLSPSAGERVSARTGEGVVQGVKTRTNVPESSLPNPLPAAQGDSMAEENGTDGKQSLRTTNRGSEGESGVTDPDFVSTLATGDKQCRSWREKLDFVRGLLARETASITTAQLVDVAIYLRFLSSGEIPCVEDGRHFRPAHHARIALQIRERLARLSGSDNTFILRKIYPWLPSSAQAFQRAEPLTRIRDIAHRNDIPSELKREIKHSLQNKLHRCAGPEDLAASAMLLERVTATGADYSPAFVEQFKIFHEELKEFFNARSLDERLGALLPSVGAKEAGLIRCFLTEKAKVGLLEQLITFRFLTELRRGFHSTIERNSTNETQELLLADIGLEDFAFVLQSQIINGFDGIQTGQVPGEMVATLAGNGSESRLQAAGRAPSVEALDRSDGLPAEAGTPNPCHSASASPIAATFLSHTQAGASWEVWLDTVLLAITNLELSGVESAECRAIAAELRAWRQSFDPADREQLLRLKATVDRSRRLAENYSERVMSLFSERAEKLGRALGVAEHAIRVFCDAEIRAHIVFQLSKLVSSLLRRIREQLALPAWDVLVGGRAVGRVKAVRFLEELRHELPEPVVALLSEVEGDEEIPKNVVGIVLAHEIPHLSHLGVRARQAKVVVVTCEESVHFAQLQNLEGQMISLTATPENVRWETATDLLPSQNREPSKLARIPKVRLNAERPWISLEQAVAECAGGKAAGARRLAELARRSGAGFKTPPALAIPFGVMEAALHAAPDVEAEYRQLLGGINGMIPGVLTSAAKRLSDLIQQLSVPEEIATEVAKRFNQNRRLMVRSSANCEDLEELAGAGLYESVANVTPSDIASAVRLVWSSLWTRRAVFSRVQAGIPHEQAYMAVLIQQMLTPDFSFVLHTVNPINHNPREVYAEIAVGLGETLASAASRGNPYRMVCKKESGAATMLAFANFTEALWPNPAGGLIRETVDYSQVELSRDPATRKTLGRRLAAISCFVEDALQQPQDIEGAVVRDEIYLVQARPQQGSLGGNDE